MLTGAAPRRPFCTGKQKLGFIVLTPEMQNAECKIKKSSDYLRKNESGGPNSVTNTAGLKSRIVSGHCPLN